MAPEPDPKPKFKQVTTSLRGAIAPIITPFIIVGGIAFGIFSPTEASVIASLYAMFLSMVIYRTLYIRGLLHVILSTIRTTAMVCLIVATASVFAWVLAAHQAPQHVAEWLLSLSKNPLVILIIINIAVFIAGFFVEGLAIMILAVPALAPTLAASGIDPIHFGVVFIFNLMIDLMTPPLGVGLFVVSGVSGIKFETLAKATLPFLVPLMVVLILLIIFPSLVTGLPNLILGS